MGEPERYEDIYAPHALDAGSSYPRTYKTTPAERDAASRRVRLLALDLMRAEQCDVNNLALQLGFAQGEVAVPEPRRISRWWTSAKARVRARLAGRGSATIPADYR